LTASELSAEDIEKQREARREVAAKEAAEGLLRERWSPSMDVVIDNNTQ
jgi:hypothetical protein